MPFGKCGEAVGAEEEIELCVRRQGLAEMLEGVGGVVGSKRTDDWGIDEGELEMGIVGDGDTSHCYAFFEAGRGAGRFEWLAANGSEENGIQVESALGRAGDTKMTVVRRVEAAAEEGDTHEAMVVPEGW
jgi:hypothetical protein